MAEAIVSALIDQLASVFRNEVEQEVRLVVGVRQEVKKLRTKLALIKEVLEDAEKKEIHDRHVKVWLEDLKDVMYDADDVLDEWNTQILISQIEGFTADGSLVANRERFYLLSLCACFKHLGVRHDIARRIKDIRERLAEVALNKDQLHLLHAEPQQPPQLTSSAVDVSKLTSSVVDVSEIFGRDHDKQEILSMLLCETSQQETRARIPILSIVGTAGFGKTTLAQLVYNEGTIATTFELKIWVCVSEPFDLERIAREIIAQAAQATGKKPPENVVGWELLHQHLCNSVKGKRFLLVLDDVWTNDSKCWTPLRLALDGGERGSKIIVTTRNEGVAKMIGSYIYGLAQLSNDDCWHIFKQVAFWGRTQQEQERLKGIGQEITKKCKGVPLAVKTLASLMQFKQAKEDWMGVLESDIWETQVEGFLPAILLSYHALPSVLKRCFMYCAIFPKDQNMEKEELVKLWMAQGYLGSNGARELERVGVEYFDALAMRSFFQDFKKNKDGNIVGCKMHDLVHDFAKYLTETDCSVLVNNEKISSHKIRHLTVDDAENPSIYEAKKLRTLLVGKASKSVPSTLPSALHQLICLRTLDLSHAYGGALKVFPSEVNRLLHLRYLDLSHTNLKELPETVRSLVNLQTLKLNKCTSLCKLPEGIGELSKLRHLEVKYTYFLKYYPRGGIERLSQLRTLSKFVVSDGSSKGSVIGELGNLNFLKGSLDIRGLKHVKSVNEAKHAELQKKKNILTLSLYFEYERDIGHVSSEEEIRRMEGVLENLEPHKESLERLEISNYVGSTLPTWMRMMSNITYLRLDYSPNLKVEPHYLFPPRLETLELYWDVGVLSKSLMSLTHNNNNLKTLQIWFCPHSSLPQGLNQLTSLQQLSFYSCQSLDFKPEELKPLTMLRKLYIYDCRFITRERSREEDWSILTHILNIQINSIKVHLEIHVFHLELSQDLDQDAGALSTHEGCFWNVIEELFEGKLLEGTVDPGNPAILVITYQYICYKIVGASQD